jgi:hypothetical protein
MPFSTPTVLDDILSCEQHLTSMTPEELPQLLALVVGHNCLYLKGKGPQGAPLNLDPDSEKKNHRRTCLIREATILSTV